MVNRTTLPNSNVDVNRSDKLGLLWMLGVFIGKDMLKQERWTDNLDSCVDLGVLEPYQNDCAEPSRVLPAYGAIY